MPTKKKKLSTNESLLMRDTITAALNDAKGLEIEILDVRKLTDITDFMIVVTGTSDRHIKTLADRVLEFMQDKSWNPLGVEGEEGKDWVLVDYVDVVVHIMRQSTRKHYDLESLWDETLSKTQNEVQDEEQTKAMDFDKAENTS